MDQQQPETQAAAVTVNRRRPHQQPPPPPPPPRKCPRCESSNTKFCYYNNYSLSQPRYFCRTCRRHWTHGGAIRNIPIGGGCRQSKRLKTSPSSDQNLQGTGVSAPQPLRPNLAPVIPPAVDNFFTGGANLPAIGSMQSLTGGFNRQAGVGFGDVSDQFRANANPFRMMSFPAAARQFQAQGDLFVPNQGLIPPARSLGGWSQNLINNTNATSSQGLINGGGSSSSSFWGCNNSADGGDLVARSSPFSGNLPWPADNNWGFSPPR